MIPTADPVEAGGHVGQQRAAGHVDRTCFSYSPVKIRVAALVLLGAATLVAMGFVASGSLVRWLWLACLLGVACLAHLLNRRAAVEAVLTVDERGIVDRRLMSKRIDWQEIEAICPVDLDRSHVVDLRLRWPSVTLAEAGWRIRIGAACQKGYDVPAITISMLLLEGHVSELLKAVAQYRPDLLHHTNRGSILLSLPRKVAPG